MHRDMGMTYWLEKAEAEMRESRMTLRIAAFILLPMMLLGVLLLRPHALFTMPSVLVDLLIGIDYHSADRRAADLAVTQRMTRSLSRRSFVALWRLTACSQ